MGVKIIKNEDYNRLFNQIREQRDSGMGITDAINYVGQLNDVNPNTLKGKWYKMVKSVEKEEMIRTINILCQPYLDDEEFIANLKVFKNAKKQIKDKLMADIFTSEELSEQ